MPNTGQNRIGGDAMEMYSCTHEGTPFQKAKPYHLEYKFGPGHSTPLCLVCGKMMVKEISK